MSKLICVYAETVDCRVAPVYHELLSKAEALRKGMEGQTTLAAVVVGSSDKEVMGILKRSGAEKVYRIGGDRLEEYNPALYGEALAQFCRSMKPEIFLFGSTAEGTELAPALGVKLTTAWI